MTEFPAIYDFSDQTWVSIPADMGAMLAGRGSDAAFVIRDAAVSRRQFEIVRTPSGLLLRQLSANVPTIVNQKRLEGERPLRHGDLIQCGQMKFRLFERAEEALLSPSFMVDDDAATVRADMSGAVDPATAAPTRFDPSASKSRVDSDPSTVDPANPKEKGQFPPTMMSTRRPAPASQSGLPPIPPPPRAPSVAVPPSAEGSSSTVFVDPRKPAVAKEIEGELPVSSGAIIGREPGRVQIFLDHPSVSRRHAQILQQGSGFSITDLGSANGTFINGQRLRGTTSMPPGTRVEIGPYRLVFTGTHFRSTTLDGNTRVIARNVCVDRVDPKHGKKRILDDVSLVIEPKQFVCILGPSGSGKTTLMNALSARATATSGKVTINGVDLYANFESLKQTIALVPQKNVLHETLRVEQSMRYTARLRLPKDARNEDVEAAVDAAIEKAGLGLHRTKFINSLSGGQQRRACLANEIICKPNLLFLDEVTSGLDEQSDRDMMQLFRSMADGGMTVVCVTHSLAHVEEFCHQVVILAAGGTLAFMGTPKEALEFFGVKKLGDVYLRIAEKSGPEWREQFIAQKAFTRLGQALVREKDEVTQYAVPMTRPFAQIIGEAQRQVGILIQRNVALALADRRNLVIALGQSGLIGILLAILFGGRAKAPNPEDIFNYQVGLMKWVAGDAKFLFLMSVVSIWFGCNNAAKEIVKESNIYERERDVNLSLEGYLLSKSIVLNVLGAIQVGILFILSSFGGFPDKPNFIWIGIHMIIAMMIGTHMGLFISAVAKSRDQAATYVPIALIPQIILSGCVVVLSNGLMKFLAGLFVSAHDIYVSLISSFPDDSRKAIDMFDTMPEIIAFGMMLIHLVVFFILALVAMIMKEGRTKAVYGRAVRDFVGMMAKTARPR